MATHSDTDAKLAVYTNVEGRMFVRPIDDFLGSVDRDGVIQARFADEQAPNTPSQGDQ